MADITIHDLDGEVLERLRRDAEAKGTSLEEAARFVLTNWHGLVQWHDETVETRRRVLEGFRDEERRSAQRMEEMNANLNAAKAKFEETKRLRPKLAEVRPGSGSSESSDKQVVGPDDKKGE